MATASPSWEPPNGDLIHARTSISGAHVGLVLEKDRCPMLIGDYGEKISAAVLGMMSHISAVR